MSETKNTNKSPTFNDIVMTVAAAGLFILLEHKEKKKKLEEKDLFLIKFSIEMLEQLKEKTKNNISKDEEKMLNDTLSNMQIAYVKIKEEKNNDDS